MDSHTQLTPHTPLMPAHAGIHSRGLQFKTESPQIDPCMRRGERGVWVVVNGFYKAVYL